MLNFFRRRDTAVRFILGGFLVLICIAMVIMLIPGGLTGDGGNNPDQTVASVDGTKISVADLNNELTRFEQGRQIPQALMPYFGRQILKNLVMEKALSEEAAKMGFTATNDEVVRAARMQDPQLFPQGQFIGQQEYQQYVSQAYQMTVPEYEERLREQIMAGKLYNLVTDSVQVNDAEVRQQFLRQNQKAVFDYVLLQPGDLEGKVNVTPEALQAFYQKNQSRYMSPERRQLDVLLANVDQMAATQQVSEAEIQQYYQANQASYSTPERVRVSHILLKTTGEAPGQLAATRQKAEKILDQVKHGTDFAKLAKQYSEDDGSADQGGELGWIRRGQTVPEFEKAAFSLKPGQISDLIQTIYGFHIIKVEAHEDAHVQTLAEVHDQIQQKLQHQKGLNAAQNAIDRSQAMAASNTPLQTIANQLHLQLISTPPISRTDPVTGIGINPEFVNAVFAASPGAVTPAVKVAQGFALAKIEKVMPPAVQPLSAVQDQVTSEFKQQQAIKLAQSEAQQLAEAAKAKGLKAAASQMKLAVKTSQPLTRKDSLADAGAISSFADALFALQPGQVGGPSALDSKQIVYSLVSVQQPPDAMFAQQKDSIRQQLLQQKRSQVFSAYTDAMEKRLTQSGKMKIDEAALLRVLGGNAPSPSPGNNNSPAPQPLGL